MRATKNAWLHRPVVDHLEQLLAPSFGYGYPPKESFERLQTLRVVNKGAVDIIESMIWLCGVRERGACHNSDRKT